MLQAMAKRVCGVKIVVSRDVVFVEKTFPCNLETRIVSSTDKSRNIIEIELKPDEILREIRKK